jgi:hypothetical protein
VVLCGSRDDGRFLNITASQEGKREEGRQDDKNGERETDRQKVRYRMKKLERAKRTTENE